MDKKTVDVDAITDPKLKTLLGESNMFMQKHAGDLVDANRKMSLVDFNHYFRAFFTGGVEDENLQPYGNAWITFAGSTTAGVDIVNPDNSLVITVPSLHDTTNIDVSGGIISRASRMKLLEGNNLPIKADADFEERLADYVEDNVAVGASSWDAFHKWLEEDVDTTIAKEAPDEFNRRSMFQ